MALLDPDVLSWAFSGEPEPDVLHGLFELRAIVEPPAASLAALRRSQKHLDATRAALDDMARHTLHIEAGRIADQQFHAALLAPIKRDPVPDHRRVFDAIAAKDAEAARAAMSELIRLAILETPVKKRPRHVAGRQHVLYAR